MTTIKRILFATDFSDASAGARERAVQICRAHGAELHVLHVQVLSPTMYMPEFNSVEGVIDEAQKAEAQRRMDALVQTIGVPVVQGIRFDVSATPAILAYADEHHIDLIVVGSHGRSGFKKLFLGSQAQDLVRSATTPTLIVPLTDDSAGPPEAFRRVLAPVDLSRPSATALHEAATIAEAHGAELIALHVVDEWYMPPHYPANLEAVQHEQAAEALTRFLAEFTLPVTPKPMALTGSPARCIVDTASATKTDLIVMATAGLGSWEHFFVGSVTERVLGRAPCAVWVCRTERATEPQSHAEGRRS